jgi:hypothetical protein
MTKLDDDLARIRKQIHENEERRRRRTKSADTDNAGNADHADKKTASKEVLVIEKGELPKVAETLRDIIAKSDRFFDRGVLFVSPRRQVAGCRLPRP